MIIYSILYKVYIASYHQASATQSPSISITKRLVVCLFIRLEALIHSAAWWSLSAILLVKKTSHNRPAHSYISEMEYFQIRKEWYIIIKNR